MSEYITTYTGKYFNPTQPNPDLISIQDIAHALSLICRGNGHVQTFWSVGQHCICCAKEAAARGLSDRMVLACLLHDASECYMSDVPTPFKKELPGEVIQDTAQMKSIMRCSCMILKICWEKCNMEKSRICRLIWIIQSGLLLK